MLFRHHRSTIECSMKTVVDLQATKEAIASYLNIDKTKIEVKKYGYDTRNKWDTYIVTVDGQAVGMTNGPIKDQL